MREFGYQRALDVSGAVALLGADPQARFLGGGTNLVDLMKIGVERPAPARRRPATAPRPDRGDQPDGGLRIGATVTNSDLAAHPRSPPPLPGAGPGGTGRRLGQLRNMATVGGNLLQRTRCGYFADVEPTVQQAHPRQWLPRRPGRAPQPCDPGCLRPLRGRRPLGHGRGADGLRRRRPLRIGGRAGRCRSRSSIRRWATPRTWRPLCRPGH